VGRERFLWIWFVVVFTIVTASADKHGHYMFAAMPVLSLLAGERLGTLARRGSLGLPLAPLAMPILTAVLCLAAGIGIGVGLPQFYPQAAGPAITIALTIGCGGLILSWLVIKRRAGAAWITALCMFLGCYVPAIGSIVPAQDRWEIIANFGRQVRQDISADQSIGVYKMGMHSVVYYLDKPVFRMESIEAVRAEVEARGKLQLVTFEICIAEFEEAGVSRVIRRLATGKESTGFNTPALVHVELIPFAAVKQPSPDRSPQTVTAFDNADGDTN
jgi:hypothetical protein